MGMNKEEARKRIRGPVVPVITPFKSDFELDLEVLRENVQFLLDGGMRMGRGVLLAGGAGGEAPMLTVEERKEVAKTVVDRANGKIVVIVGAQHTDPRQVVELSRYAEDVGADAVQLSPPFYYTPSDEDVVRFFRMVAESIGIGIMVYNTYWLGFNISHQLMARLAELDNVVSIKWSAPNNHAYLMGYRLFAEKMAVIDNTGPVLLIWSHMLGATGFITHVASYWPQHELMIWDLLEKGEYVRVKEELAKLNWPWYDFRVKMGEATGGEANVIKAAMEMVGLKAGPPRSPTMPLTPEQREELRKILVEGGVNLMRA